MNKYLEKVAEFLSDENKTVAKTFGVQMAASVPTHLAGGAAGVALGDRYLQGAAGKINRGMAHAATAASKAGRPGMWLAKKLHGAGGLTGAALGGVVGMQLAGGLGDLAALKHGVHGKVNEK